MADLVVDSCVAIKWFIVEQYSTEARRILTEYQSGRLTLLAPDLIYAEISNIAWKKHIFQGLDATSARLIVDGFQQLTLQVTSTAFLVKEAYTLAVAYQRSVYDALYLALSEREHCQFVTADERLVNAVGAAFPNVIWLPNWP
jgi:predicted nucleic acid-binding protein